MLHQPSSVDIHISQKSRMEEEEKEEEEEVEIYGEELDNMFDYNPFGYGRGPGRPSTPPPPPSRDDPLDDDDLDDDEMTDEQWSIYFAAAHKTDGFDVPHFPGVSEFCQIIPMNFNIKEDQDLCVEYSKLAVDKYNEKLKDTEGELDFVKVLLGMSKASRGFMYYLTFDAKNLAKGGLAFTYQAVVLHGIDDKIEVLSFRLKPGQEGVTQKRWFWQGHLCGQEIET